MHGVLGQPKCTSWWPSYEKVEWRCYAATSSPVLKLSQKFEEEEEEEVILALPTMSNNGNEIYNAPSNLNSLAEIWILYERWKVGQKAGWL